MVKSIANVIANVMAIAVIFLATFSLANAADDLGQSLRPCALLQSPDDRLECYDRLAASLANGDAIASTATKTPSAKHVRKPASQAKTSRNDFDPW